MHIIGEVFNAEAGVKAAHVPYRGVAPALNDLIGGHIQFLSADLPVLEPLVKSGKVRALALFATERSPLLPDLPTSAELGYPGMLMEQLVRHAGARRHCRADAGHAREGDARDDEKSLRSPRGSRPAACAARPTARASARASNATSPIGGRRSRRSASPASSEASAHEPVAVVRRR